MMTSAQVVETSVNVTNNSPSRDYSHPDDQTTQTIDTCLRYCVLRKENSNFVRLLKEQLKCVLDVKKLCQTDDIESIAGISSREV